MKKSVLLTASLLTISFLSCQDAKEEQPVSPSVAEYRNVGMQIPTDMGARWIQAYQKTKSSGRTDGGYTVTSDKINLVLQSVTDLVGVAFQYGFDEYGNKHIILIPVDGNLRLWNALGGRVYLDANTNSVISKETAYTWARSYQTQNPNGIWFHYFGAVIFDDITATTGFTALDIVPAVNDLDLSQELLLVIGDTEDLVTGRTATSTTVYDASYPCPRCEVQ